MEPAEPGFHVMPCHRFDGDVLGVEPDVKLSQVSLVSLERGAFVSGSEGVEKLPCRSWERRARAWPGASGVETQQATGMQPIEVAQSQMSESSASSLWQWRLMELREELLDFARLELK